MRWMSRHVIAATYSGISISLKVAGDPTASETVVRLGGVWRFAGGFSIPNAIGTQLLKAITLYA